MPSPHSVSKVSLPQPTPDDPELHFRTGHLKADLKFRTARGGFVTVVSQGVKFVAGMAGTFILGRLLTPGDYGLIGMVTVIIGFAALFKDLGLSAATIQREEITPAQVSTLLWVNVGVSVAAMILTAAAAPAVAWFYHEPRLTLITVAFAACFLAGGFSIQHEALLRRQMRFGTLATLEIGSLLVGLAGAIVLAWYGAGYWALVVNQFLTSIVYAAGVWMTCPWRPGPPERGSGVRSMLAFGGNLTGFNVVNYFGANLDNVLIGRFWGPQQLGFYAKAYQLLLLPINQINTPVATVSVPALSLASSDAEQYRSAYLRIVEKLEIVTMPLAAFMALTSDWLVSIVLGPQWTESARIFAIFGLGASLLPVLNSTGWLFITQGRTHDMFHWGFIDVIFKVVSVAAGLPWGATGVAVGMVARTYLQAPLLFWYVGRKGPVRAADFYRVIAAPFCAYLMTLTALTGLRRILPADVSPLAGLTAAFGVAAGMTVLVLGALPKGREALKDLKGILFLLVARRAA